MKIILGLLSILLWYLGFAFIMWDLTWAMIEHNWFQRSIYVLLVFASICAITGYDDL